ncbi:hypothetical protein FA13DRAFT_1633750 [Coprinellus micaceus]|uniref:Glycosyltransferase family 18 catalytic domain-containing protein n=1 Tax=Coprinellus micaceus TaxID=71717 RepID=A0A4Y7T271_COPMI|nr:hypothetical protein FA13DRAFT_1633750 [Coprinellus micaceus]
MVTEYGDYAFLPSSLSRLFPAPDTGRKDYREWNALSIRELHVCLALDNCGVNQRKVALLASHWFEESIVRGYTGGEGIWARSMYKHLKAMGYTTIFADSFEEALAIYRHFPSLVSVVIRNNAGECHSDPKCVMSEANPTGIPAWKIFDFEYFPATTTGYIEGSLMKGKWVLSANPEQGNRSVIQYIGYSVEDDCRRIPPIPLSQRKDQIFILMKQLTYANDARFAWNRSYFPLASSELGVSFTGAWLVDEHWGWNPEEMGPLADIEDRERGVVNLINGAGAGANRTALLSPQRWAEEVGMSKAMLGVGNPWWSPSPYHALCAGVPFINPITEFDPNDPWNRDKWRTQHGSLDHLDPPYVYHVHKQNYTGFVDALKAATTTEIPSFIPSYMTEAAVRERVRYLMEHEWKEEARKLLEERKAGRGRVYIRALMLSYRSRDLKRCPAAPMRHRLG